LQAGNKNPKQVVYPSLHLWQSCYW